MILTLVSWAKNALTGFFVLNYELGEFLVTSVYFLIKFLYVIGEKAYIISEILINDFDIFIRDVERKAQYLMLLTTEIGSEMYDSAIWTMETAQGLLMPIKLGISRVFNDWTTILYDVWTLLNSMAFAFGAFICGVITGTASLFNYLLTFCNDIVTNVPKFINIIVRSFCDICVLLVTIPIESFTGWTLLLCIALTCAKFNLYIYNTLKNLLMLFYKRLSFRLKLWKYKCWILTRKKPRRNSTDEKINQYLCIICQERFRVIVNMPCRHLCTCVECNHNLKRYYTTCPICRQKIDISMPIFT